MAFIAVVSQATSYLPHAQAVMNDIRFSEHATAGRAPRDVQELPSHPQTPTLDRVVAEIRRTLWLLWALCCCGNTDPRRTWRILTS